MAGAAAPNYKLTGTVPPGRSIPAAGYATDRSHAAVRSIRNPSSHQQEEVEAAAGYHRLRLAKIRMFAPHAQEIKHEPELAEHRPPFFQSPLYDLEQVIRNRKQRRGEQRSD